MAELGVAIMALLPDALAAGFPDQVDGVGPHATALYFLVDEGAKGQAMEAAMRAVVQARPFDVQLGELESREGDDGTVWAVGVDSPGLAELRVAVLAELDAADVAYQLTHGGEFWPHATVAVGGDAPAAPTGAAQVERVVVSPKGGPSAVFYIAHDDGKLEFAADLQTRLVLGDAPETYRTPDAPAGLHVPDKPWRIFSVGSIHCIFSGKLRREVTLEDLQHLVAYFQATKAESTVPIDWNHGEDSSLGQVLDLYVYDEQDGRGPGLYAVVGLTEAGRACVEAHGGTGERPHLWTSPTIRWGDMFAKDTGERLSGAGMLRLALTPEPASNTSKISPARLNVHDGTPADSAPLGQEEEAMEPKDQQGGEMTLEEALAKIMELEQKLADMEGARESAQSTAGEVMQANTQLRGELDKYASRLSEVEQELADTRAEKAVDELMLQGKISGDERGKALKAYANREAVPEFWDMFAARPANTKVQVNGTRTHGADGDTLDDFSLNKKLKADIEKHMAEHNCTQGEAVTAVRNATDPDVWSRALRAVPSAS